jgi:hypothetical protein
MQYMKEAEGLLRTPSKEPITGPAMLISMIKAMNTVSMERAPQAWLNIFYWFRRYLKQGAPARDLKLYFQL